MQLNPSERGVLLDVIDILSDLADLHDEKENVAAAEEVSAYITDLSEMVNSAVTI